MSRYLHFIRRHWGKLVLGLLLVAVVWWLLARPGGLSKEMLVDYGHRLPVFWFIIAFLILPLVGFPITPFLIICGFRFGFTGGMLVAAAGVFIHHIVAFHLVHGRLRENVGNRLLKRGYTIPNPSEKNRAWFTMAFAAIHGPPYTVKLYLLALTDIPFRTYFWVGAPVYILFCAIPVGVGGSSLAVSPWWLYGALFAMMGVGFLGRWLKQRSSGKDGLEME